MNKNQPGNKKKWTFAILAAAIMVGGTYGAAPMSAKTASPNAKPAAPSVMPAVVAPVISVDPKRGSVSAARKALIKLEVMTFHTAAASNLDSSDETYRSMHKATIRANQVSSDPNSSQELIFFTARKLEKAIDRYNAKAVPDAKVLAPILKYEKAVVLNGEGERSLDEIEWVAYRGVLEAQAKLAADSTEAGTQAAYKHFLSHAVDAKNLKESNPAAELSFLKRYEANAAELDSTGPNAAQALHLKKAYEQAMQALRSAANRSSNEWHAAAACVIVTFQAFKQGLGLAEELDRARSLLDSAVGAAQQTHSTSSIRKLGHAIRQADNALQTAGVGEELEDAREKLADAMWAFKASGT